MDCCNLRSDVEADAVKDHFLYMKIRRHWIGFASGSLVSLLTRIGGFPTGGLAALFVAAGISVSPCPEGQVYV